MNEPTIAVALVVLGVIMAALVIPAPVLAYAARRSERALFLTSICIMVALTAPLAIHFGGRSELNSGDQALYRNLAILAIVATAAAAWRVRRKLQQEPNAPFVTLLVTAASTQIFAAVIFAILPKWC